jgi:hypothetical protein
MKKILGILAAVCLSCDLSANIDVTASSNSFLSSSNDPIVFKVTNNGSAKTQLKVTILRESTPNLNSGCAGGSADLGDSCANEDFCITGQDIYIPSGDNAEIKVIPLLIERIKEPTGYKVVFSDSSNNTVAVSITAVAPQQETIVLDKLIKDSNGMLKAVTHRGPENEKAL